MKFSTMTRSIAAIVCCVSISLASAQDVKLIDGPPPPADPHPGSLYLQCDGNPNNMSAGESVARIVGIIALVGLFAPSPEWPDPSKRKFGDAGVAACSELIDGPRAETFAVRRLPLLLGRALHHIEARNYKGAVADVGRARDEARTAGLVGNPYFDRSLGLSFDMIEAEALLRDGDVKRAREVSLRRAERYKFSYYPLIGADDYGPFDHEQNPLGIVRARNLARITPLQLNNAATILERDGKFSEAAVLRVAFDEFLESLGEGTRSSFAKANAALSEALAGHWEQAAALARSARTNLATRADNGKPEQNASGTVELLDLYDIVLLAHDGKIAVARRNFAARSQWLAPGFGQVVTINAMLRAGASADELEGGLAKSPETMWTEQRSRLLAVLLELDKNNKTLWARILPYASADTYEALSKQVWNGTKSSIIGKDVDKTFNAYPMALGMAGPLTQVDGLLLHAAVVAKARGYSGFAFFMLPQSPSRGWVRFGKAGDPGITSDQYLDADAVIAELRDVIPTPEETKARRAARALAPKS